jgi:hypothetical protein
MLSEELLQRSQLPRVLYVDVYPFRRVPTGIEYLIFKRLESVVMPGVWQPICGKLGEGESIAEAFASQVRKKTGDQSSKFIAIDHITTYYDMHYDVVMIVPSVGVEISTSTPKLDGKLHSEYRWISYADIPAYIKFAGQLVAYSKLDSTLSF